MGCNIGCSMVPSRTRLGGFLRKRRLGLKLSQAQVAARLGVSQSLYSTLEVGLKKRPDQAQIKNLTSVLKCSQREIRSRTLKKERERLPRTKLGKLIRKRRLIVGISKFELSKRLGRKLTAASGIEKKKYILVSEIKIWAKALECHISLLEPFALRGKRKKCKSARGAFIRTQRDKCNLSLGETAKIIGVSRQLLSCLEIGRIKTIKKMCQLAQLLNFDQSIFETRTAA